MSPTEALSVWLYESRVADIERGRNGRLSLRFSEEALDRFGPDSPILSTSMPTRMEPYPNARTRDFLEGLLPEAAARTTEVDADHPDTHMQQAPAHANHVGCIGSTRKTVHQHRRRTSPLHQQKRRHPHRSCNHRPLPVLHSHLLTSWIRTIHD